MRENKALLLSSCVLQLCRAPRFGGLNEPLAGTVRNWPLLSYTQKLQSLGVALHESRLAALPSMSTPARKRLMRDFKRLRNDPPQGVNATPHSDNIMLWNAVIFGPEDTPWDGGTFKLSMEFAEDYPNKPPVVKFISPMFHPNIYADGSICLDILQNQWSPIYDVAAVLTSIQSLLCDPNPASPANSEAAKLYADNRREYNKRVKEVVEKSWVDDGADAEEEVNGEAQKK